MNKIKYINKNSIFIQSSINEFFLTELQNYAYPIEFIGFNESEFGTEDFKILNEYFKKNKNVVLRFVEKGYLEHFPDLENIEYGKTEFDNSMFDELKHLKNLNSIDFRTLGGKLDISPLIEYKNTLKGLAFEGDLTKNGEEIISQLSNLKKVAFISSKFKSFEFLSDLKLEIFKYYGSRTINYEDLVRIKSLKYFWLKTNTKWDNFDFLSELENIETIELHYVSGIQEFPKCSHLKNLKRVISFDCNNLTNIDELKKLSNCYVHAYGKKIENKFYQHNGS